MKGRILFSILIIFAFEFWSCSKHDDSNSGTLTQATVSAKWVISGTGIGYRSFEFNKSGNYIVVADDGTKSTAAQIVLFGTYQITDNQTIVLSDLGTLKMSSISSSSFSFTFTPLNDASGKISLTSVKAAITATSAKTDLLCRTWSLVTLGGESVAGTENELTVLFSNAGTYYVNRINIPEDSGLAQWGWKDNTQSTLCYSWEGAPTCDGTNEVLITEVTGTSLKMDEEGEIYILKPATMKSASVKSIYRIKSGVGKSKWFRP
ncbi:MAG: hypothetical protein WCJ95_04115 [Mariniphaga sp.]